MTTFLLGETGAMKTIHKFKLSAFDSEGIEVRSTTFKPLTVQLNGNPANPDMMDIMLWAEVDMEPTETPQLRRINVVGTGWEFDPEKAGAYISTVQVGTWLSGKPFVWHFFDGGWA